ncbi:hypothetical protein J2S50_005417 [Streptomyces sp. DSM 40167]|nr:hypothetical protein [Streptomyces sp. DSM 40167]
MRTRSTWRTARPWAVRGCVAVAVVVAYFLLPLDRLGPHRPVLSWVLCALLLAVVAALPLRRIHHVLVDRPETGPGVVITMRLQLRLPHRRRDRAQHAGARHGGAAHGPGPDRLAGDVSAAQGGWSGYPPTGARLSPPPWEHYCRHALVNGKSGVMPVRPSPL